MSKKVIKTPISNYYFFFLKISAVEKNNPTKNFANLNDINPSSINIKQSR